MVGRMVLLAFHLFPYLELEARNLVSSGGGPGFSGGVAMIEGDIAVYQFGDGCGDHGIPPYP